MEVVAYAILTAKAAGCVLIYNGAPALPIASETLQMVDYFIINEAEASYYSGLHVEDETTARQGARALLTGLLGSLIITLGSQGSLIADKGDTYIIPALTVKAIETTGAGDSYVGALAYGLLHGYPLIEAAKIATKAASITVSAVGAQPAMPTLQKLLS